MTFTHPTGPSGPGPGGDSGTGPNRTWRQTRDCVIAWGRVAHAVAELTVSLAKGGAQW